MYYSKLANTLHIYTTKPIQDHNSFTVSGLGHFLTAIIFPSSESFTFLQFNSLIFNHGEGFPLFILTIIFKKLNGMIDTQTFYLTLLYISYLSNTLANQLMVIYNFLRSSYRCFPFNSTLQVLHIYILI